MHVYIYFEEGTCKEFIVKLSLKRTWSFPIFLFLGRDLWILLFVMAVSSIVFYTFLLWYALIKGARPRPWCDCCLKNFCPFCILQRTKNLDHSRWKCFTSNFYQLFKMLYKFSCIWKRKIVVIILLVWQKYIKYSYEGFGSKLLYT